ncbi:glycosyltransferase, partial [Vibrio harveyi]|nr:glycosyltransferase [Vibrio harveyi]
YALKGVANNVKQAHLWPNGVHDFWLEKGNNLPSDLASKRNHLSFLYVGRFNENKNLRNLTFAHEQLLSLGYDVSITYVGGSTEDFERCTGFSASELKNSTIIGRLDMKSLSEIYSQSTCLVVPSFFETFGLVYIESLSRNCPVICSIGQGIYGLFPECKSIKFVSPDSVESICEQMLFFIKNDLTMSDFPNLENFRWNYISETIYCDLKRFL